MESVETDDEDWNNPNPLPKLNKDSLEAEMNEICMSSSLKKYRNQPLGFCVDITSPIYAIDCMELNRIPSESGCIVYLIGKYANQFRSADASYSSLGSFIFLLTTPAVMPIYNQRVMVPDDVPEILGIDVLHKHQLIPDKV